MMIIPDYFEQEEIRSEYKVSVNRKRLWISELKMLCWLEDICNNNNIDFFLIGGSELGVVRHAGFIPWDDDIDIGMLRDDFDRFINLMKNEHHYVVQYGLDEVNGIYDRICRIRDDSTTGIVYDQVGKHRSQGVFIEIYPYDFVPDEKQDQKKHAKMIAFYQRIIRNKIEKNTGIKSRLINGLLIFVSVKALNKKLERLYRKYDNETRKYVSSVTLPQYYYSGSEVLPYKYVCKSRYESFEFLKTRVPIFAEKCLAIEYGEYMTLPPIQERGKHHNELVFYDPNNSWRKYESYASVEELFGEFGYLLDE